jgi:hypothetical protein
MQNPFGNDVRSSWLLLSAAVLLTALALLMPARVHAQAEVAGFEPGSFVAVGVTGSGFNSGYGQQRLVGPAVYLDANLYRRAGAEFEARTLRFHAQENLRQSTYLAGVRFSTHGRGDWRPYTKLLGGLGVMTFPFRDARGRYLVAVPGLGLDYRVRRTGILVRMVDVEYQYWPGFTFGPLRTWGVSSGVSLRVW